MGTGARRLSQMCQPMKIVLTQNAGLYPPIGGAGKANAKILEQLSQAGHRCIAILPSTTMHRETARDSNARPRTDGSTIEVHVAEEASPRDRLRLRNTCRLLEKTIREVEPDWILVASEDSTLNLLDRAISLAPDRVVLLARSAAMLGIGPNCFFASGRAKGLIQRVRHVVCNSRYLAEYVKTFGGVEASVLDVDTYTPTRLLEDTPLTVTMINPCAVKGISIFLELAKARPAYHFAAVPGWGTTAADLDSLRAVGVEILPWSVDVSSIWAQTGVLLVPSLWDEAFGRVVVEAMSFGIPVVTSDSGGLKEAKLGVPFLLPINGVTGYRPILDARGVSVAVVPPQRIQPWLTCLDRLLGNSQLRRSVSLQSHSAACSYIRGLDPRGLERILDRLSFQ